MFSHLFKTIFERNITIGNGFANNCRLDELNRFRITAQLFFNAFSGSSIRVYSYCYSPGILVDSIQCKYIIIFDETNNEKIIFPTQYLCSM